MLTRIFFRMKQKKQSSLGRNALNGCLMAQEAFNTRLHQERLRSDRSGLPLSLVILDLVGLLELLAAGNGFSHHRFVQYLRHTLENSTRESDIKGWHQKGKIALLAPDTNESGAQVLSEKITKYIMEYHGLNALIQESDVRRFFTISSLENGGGYFADSNEDKNVTSNVSMMQNYYRYELNTDQSLTPYTLAAAGQVDVAMIQWPFSFEILDQEQLVRMQFKMKRVMDIVGSIVGIVLSAPLMLFIAVVIKLTSPGPVLFRQQRRGLLGNPFTFLKFRSMKINSDPTVHKDYVKELIEGKHDAVNNGTKEVPVFKITNDRRVTPFGRFLRKTSLDELPQLFNVLKGDMSLVGPRPHPIYECQLYKTWHCRRVLEVKPGITGLWQVAGRSSISYDEMVRLDIAYIRTWNLRLDLKILLKTPSATLSTKGAC